jgi:hypothetical protein
MLTSLLNDAADVFTTWFRESSACLLICGTNGEILCVNRSFETWSGYTSHELSRSGMEVLSSHGNDFTIESELVRDCIELRRTQYVLQKHLVPKGSKPRAGEFSAVRYPTGGEIQWFLCSWTPFRSDSSEALKLAIGHIQEARGMLQTHNQAIAELDKRLADRDKVTDGERLWLLSGKLMIKHPKMAWAVFVALVSLFVSANLLSILKNIAGIQTTMEMRDQLAPVADGIVFHAKPQDGSGVMPVTLLTPGGNTIEFGDPDGMRDGTGTGRPDFGTLGRSFGRVRHPSLENLGLGWPDAGCGAGVGDVSAGPSWRAGDGKSGDIF